MRKIKVNGKTLEVVTYSQLAKMCKKTTVSLRNMESAGILPMPNIRLQDKAYPSGFVRKGQRFYTYDLALKIQKILLNVTQGKKVSTDVATLLSLAFKEEKKCLQN